MAFLHPRRFFSSKTPKSKNALKIFFKSNLKTWSMNLLVAKLDFHKKSNSTIENSNIPQNITRSFQILLSQYLEFIQKFSKDFLKFLSKHREKWLFRLRGGFSHQKHESPKMHMNLLKKVQNSNFSFFLVRIGLLLYLKYFILTKSSLQSF